MEYVICFLSLSMFFILVIVIIYSQAYFNNIPYDNSLDYKKVINEDKVLEALLNDYFYRYYLIKKKENLEETIAYLKKNKKLFKVFSSFKDKQREYLVKYLVENDKIKSNLKINFLLKDGYEITKSFNNKFDFIHDSKLEEIFCCKIRGILIDNHYLIIYNKYLLYIDKNTFAISAKNIASSVLKSSSETICEFSLKEYAYTQGIKWEHAKNDGTPDRRYSVNRKMYINIYYFLQINDYEFKLYNYNKKIKEIVEGFEKAKNDVIDSENDGLFFIESIKVTKSYSKYCVLYDNKYYGLIAIVDDKYMIYANGKTVVFEIGNVVPELCLDLNEMNAKLEESRKNIGKHIYFDNVMYTITSVDNANLAVFSFLSTA